jgi:hypothetical protein
MVLPYMEGTSDQSGWSCLIWKVHWTGVNGPINYGRYIRHLTLVVHCNMSANCFPVDNLHMAGNRASPLTDAMSRCKLFLWSQFAISQPLSL